MTAYFTAADAADADHIADQVGARRKHKIRRRSGANQKLDFACRGCGLFQKPAHRLRTEMRGAEALSPQDAPFLDAGALDDPFVAGLDHLRQFGIAQDVGRHIAEHAGDRGVDRKLSNRFSGFGHANASVRGG